jgi:hypothetical protein
MRGLRAIALCLGLVLLGSVAAAKDTCVHTDGDGGWTFVLKKASLKRGASGAVAGYAVQDGGAAASPIHGAYLVVSDFMFLGVTRPSVFASLSTPGTGSASPATAFHQLLVPVDGSALAGGDNFWRRNENATISDGQADSQLVDCAGVAVLPTAP